VGQGTRRQSASVHRLRRTEIARCGVERADDVLVDLAVQHLNRRHLHDCGGPSALRGEDVELCPFAAYRATRPEWQELGVRLVDGAAGYSRSIHA